MGSGLILMVIVGAWLAVLVPMALRSHDAATASRSAERFGDAMRVLSPRSRRTPAERPPVEPPPALEPLLRSMREVEPRPPLTLVQRRRRVLLTLLGAAAVSLLGGLLTVWLLGLGLVLLALAVAYVVHLRRLALAREERLVRSAGSAPLPAFDRMPPRVGPLPARSVRHEEPLPMAVGDQTWGGTYDDAAYDGTWTSRPVPPPVYVGKPVAPPRPPQVLDLSEPGRASGAVTAGELGDAPDLELDDILDGRRAVGGW